MSNKNFINECIYAFMPLIVKGAYYMPTYYTKQCSDTIVKKAQFAIELNNGAF